MSTLSTWFAKLHSAVTLTAVASMITLSLSPSLAAQQPVQLVHAAKAEAAFTPAKSESAETRPANGSIRVHGHWVMELKDKDGKVVGHRDFENSLDSADGGSTLTNLLLGVYVMENFSLLLNDYAAPTLNNYLVTIPGSLLALNCVGLVTAPGCFPTLTTVRSGNKLILSGQVTPAAGATIGAVSSLVIACLNIPASGTNFGPTTTTPATCKVAGTSGATLNHTSYTNFTGTTIANPIIVTAGQTLTITVTLSFS